MIFGRVKGGFTVDLSGAVAFLPGSQVDIRPVRDICPLLNKPQPFQILKMDRRRGNIVVPRRAVLEESRAEQRNELVANLKEGQVLSGVVKNITDYGAFVDLGGVDGLLHVTDIAWRRINHPCEALQIGQTVTVQVIRFNPETQRISLGMKQLEADPWEGVELKYPVGAKFTGRVTNITDYGAFVELEPGVEGLVHVSEMSWTKKNVHPGKIVSTTQEVEVMVLDVDPEKRRIRLGLKQCLDNPWELFQEQHPVGAPSWKARSGTSPSSACSSAWPATSTAWSTSPISDWNKPAEEATPSTRRATRSRPWSSTSTSRRSASAWASSSSPRTRSRGDLRPEEGRRVTCVVTAVTRAASRWPPRTASPGSSARPSCRVSASSSAPTVSPSARRSTPRSPTSTMRSRRVTLSIKAMEIEEEKQAMAEYGSSDLGASLGDILGPAIKERQEQQEQSQD